MEGVDGAGLSGASGARTTTGGPTLPLQPGFLPEPHPAPAVMGALVDSGGGWWGGATWKRRGGIPSLGSPTASGVSWPWPHV